MFPACVIGVSGGRQKNFGKCRNASLPHVINVKPRKNSARKNEKRNRIMKYALLVFQPQEQFDRPRDSAMAAAGKAYGEALRAAGVVVTAAGLQPPESATMVSVRDGKRHVHDGPYAETKEFLGGFVIIDVPNLDAALEWAARNPAAAYSVVEVRPLFAYS
jgi:hypothetical protein